MMDVSNKVFDNLINLLVEKSKSEIEEIFDLRSRNRMLRKSLEQFGKFCTENTEYRDVIFVGETCNTLAIAEEKLNPALSVDDLAENIREIVSTSFCIPEEVNKDHFTKVVATYYKKRAIVEVRLAEISAQLALQHEDVLEYLDEVKSMVQKQEVREIKIHQKREYVYNKFIRRKISEFIGMICSLTYHLIFKESIQTKGNQDLVINTFESIQERKEQLNQFIDNQYWKKRVNFITVNPDGSLKPMEHQFSPARFIHELYIPQIDKGIKELLDYKDIFPDGLYYQLLELDGVIHEGSFMAIRQGAQSMLENATCRAEDEIKELETLCNVILGFKEYYL